MFLEKNGKSIIVSIVILLIFFVLYISSVLLFDGTYGLKGNLKKLDHVISIDEYYTHDGDAFFTLQLSENRQMKLGAIENIDLTKSDGMIILGVGSSKIICKRSIGGGYTSGIYTNYIGQDKIDPQAIINIPNMINHYDELEALFNSMPIEFSSENALVICKNNNSKQLEIN